MEIEVHLLDSHRDIPTIENNLWSFQENNFSSSQATSQVKTDTLQNNLLPKVRFKFYIFTIILFISSFKYNFINLYLPYKNFWIFHLEE